jgi:hypothetical protein
MPSGAVAFTVMAMVPPKMAPGGGQVTARNGGFDGAGTLESRPPCVLVPFYNVVPALE